MSRDIIKVELSLLIISSVNVKTKYVELDNFFFIQKKSKKKLTYFYMSTFFLDKKKLSKKKVDI